MRDMRSFHKFDDPDDPAMQAVYEGGGGEAEGFELAEQDLIEHASHGDMHGTTKILQDAEGFTEEERTPDDDAGLYGEADSEAANDGEGRDLGES